MSAHNATFSNVCSRTTHHEKPLCRWIRARGVRRRSARISSFGVSHRRNWHLTQAKPLLVCAAGCRGFVGPFPPPLVIRATDLCGCGGYDTTGRGEVKEDWRLGDWRFGVSNRQSLPIIVHVQGELDGSLYVLHPARGKSRDKRAKLSFLHSLQVIQIDRTQFSYAVFFRC